MNNEMEKAGVFGLGPPNDAFAQYFIGQSYLNPVATEGIGIFNVTFEPGCRNNWHIAVEVPGENTRSEWCQPVTDREYNGLK